jgi:hypothetical protein
MQKKPEDRFANPAEVIDALRPLAVPPLNLAAVTSPSSLRNVSLDRAGPGQSAAAERPPVSARSVADFNLRLPAGSSLLPSRQSLRHAPLADQHDPHSGPDEMPKPASGRGEPAGYSEPASSWDERFGTVGIVAAALLACVVAWWVTWKWNLF